jgi:cytochrome oxidase Cu insertion factor (SCO1/SenC/PrrC family)
MEFSHWRQKEIYTLARKSYLAVKLGKPSELYDMVHTENFVLVDTKKEFVAFMTEQRHQTTYRRHYFTN